MQTMKDSGIEWIGEIPKDWTKSRLKFYGKVQGRIGFKGYTVQDLVYENEEGRAIVLGGTNISSDGKILYDQITYLSEEKYLESPEIMLHGEEILITKVGAGSGENAIYHYKEERVTINPNVMLFICNPNILHSPFVNYFLLNPIIKQEIKLESNNSGAQPAINQEYLKNLFFSCPSLLEQQLIADYLDKKCGEIDGNITDIEKSIEKLQEYKKSVITEAVTKGLDPTAPLKNSDIDWIGEIPGRWEAKKSKHLFIIFGGGTPSTSNTDFWDGKIMWVTPADYDEDTEYIVETKRTITEIGLADIGNCIAPAESIILSNRAPIGQVALCKNNVSTNQGCKMLIKRKGVNSKYYYYCLKVLKDKLTSLGKGTTFLELSLYDLNNFALPSPCLDEQTQIVNYLDKKYSEIEQIIADKKELLKKLKEYKQSLIYECVTGKREAV